MTTDIAEQSPRRSSLVQDLANAPGTLPQPEVEARFQSLEVQFRHDNTIAPLAPRPAQPVEITATSGSGMRVERAAVFYTTDGTEPTLRSSSIPMEIGRVLWDVRVGYLSEWKSTLPGLPEGSRVRYRIGGWCSGLQHNQEAEPDLWAHDGSGFWFRDQGPTGVSVFAYAVEPARSPMPDWMERAVIYQIFLDRFHPGTEDGRFHGIEDPRARHGGTLSGVRHSLPYLHDLGVTCLWLSPLHLSETYHRYDTMDFFGVDPQLGTVQEMRSLVDEAHALGMRVVLDFVPSHLSWRHPAFLEAQRDRDSASASWFTFYDWPHSYRSFLNLTRFLPSINTNDEGARRHLIESASFWVGEMGVDGFRLDHAIGPSMDFWVEFRTALERVNGEIVLFGEATDTPDCLRRYRGKLHGILDFEMAAALRLTLGREGWGVGQLEDFVTSYERFMADGPGRVSFLDNHDMDRFLWVAGNDVTRLKLAALCQFTLSPTPVIYYGTEIGMTQRAGARDSGFGGDAEARRDMPWDEQEWNRDLLDFYRSLVALRRSEASLQSGARAIFHLDEESGTWTYRRSEALDQEPGTGDALVAFNLGDAEAEVELPWEIDAERLCPVFSTGSDARIVPGAQPSLRVQARTGVVVRVV